MLPIVLNPTAITVGLAGGGEGLARRRRLLAEAGIEPVSVTSDCASEALEDLDLLLLAGLDRDTAEALAGQARDCGILVNVEDVPELCDFHIPAAIRRGDLVLTVSTGGKSPGLARLIREWLEHKLGAEWSGRLKEIASARTRWRREGNSASDVSSLTRDFVETRAWLP